jgi:membrane protein implicated in regulation of membrane protease activity
MFVAGMGILLALSSVCLAEYGAIKGLAVIALGIIVYLFWSSFQEKRERRRQRRAMEQRRRAKEAGGAQD